MLSPILSFESMPWDEGWGLAVSERRGFREAREVPALACS